MTINIPENACKAYGKIYQYPNGTFDIIGGDRHIFGPKGLENDSEPCRKKSKKETPDPEDLERARRRARAKVRRLALANEFRWFVTLTLDKEKIDRYDEKLIVRRMSQWCSNQVKRRGLKYILVPEHHKDGAIHFHGFFNDVLEAVDSGKTDKNGHKIYNLPQWTYGFTTAIELYGEYSCAVAYVVKYIGKDCAKIGGRWYYSGGELAQPVEIFVDIDSRDIMETYPGAWMKITPGGIFAGANGIKEETT